MQAESQMIGRMIDSYEITELIGRGGMGVVYKARDVKLDRDVALKIMDPLLAREEAFLKRFWSEAKALAKLQNPYIVGIYALRETEFGICIVMEYVEGTTLGDLIKASGPLHVEQAIYLFKQLLMAFEHAHAAGIIHRDVKPGNILVTENNMAKVTDFGLAKIYQSSAATLTSITGGTLFYASPEQLEGLGKVDKRGDIYSLGMTLYESLTGAVPFANTESDFATREKIVKGRIPSPRGMKPEIPAELNAIVMKAIAKDPQDRFQTATEMREALEDFEASLKRAHAKPTRSSRRALRPLWLLVPIVVLLAVVGVILYPRIFADQATITVRSTPIGARVEIDGRMIGTTPIRNYAIAAGQAVISLSESGYVSKDTTIMVPEEERLILAFELQSTTLGQSAEEKGVLSPVESPPVQREIPKRQATVKEHLPPPVSVPHQPPPESKKQAEPPVATKTGSILVTVAPSSAVVWIDFVRVQSMPYQVLPGDHFVRVVSKSNVWERTVTVAAGRAEDIDVDFTKQVRVLVRAVDVEGNPVRGAKIFYDGSPIAAAAPAEVKMSFGNHTITLQREGYEDPQPVVQCFEHDLVYPNAVTVVLKKAK